MKKVFLITDYKGYFGSKYYAVPYRAGFDREQLAECFRRKGYEAVYVKPVPEDIRKHDLSEGVIIFASHQDHDLHYKGYLEDLAFALEASGYRICPPAFLIKAHENKVFFEMLRNLSKSPSIKTIKSWFYGTYEEFSEAAGLLPYPVLIKTSGGSMSRGVSLARSEWEAKKTVKKKMRTINRYRQVWDMIRSVRHRNYKRESWRRKKIVVQEYIPGLQNDYKVLVFGLRYYVLYRGVRKGDFRASGQGLLSYRKELPESLLDFARDCFMVFDAPQASFDIGFDGSAFYLFEAQYVCFGTYTIENAPFYFIKEGEQWILVEQRSCLEEEYVESMISFIEK